MADLEAALRSVLARGGRAFVPYVTGGLAAVDADLLRGLEAAGADAIEVGIPFSDPVMDGPVIQEASRRALVDGATPSSVLGIVKEAGLGVPVAVMTYANPVWHAGLEAFLDACVDAGVSGVDRARPPGGRGERVEERLRGGVGRPGLPRRTRQLRTTSSGHRGGVPGVRVLRGDLRGHGGARTPGARPPPSSSPACAPSPIGRCSSAWGSPSRPRPPRRARSPTVWSWGAHWFARCSRPTRPPRSGSRARSGRPSTRRSSQVSYDSPPTARVPYILRNRVGCPEWPPACRM